ncbi:MAG TPA: PEGA domain-containing protein [Gammaproteobacteria bacterium]|nr:PEGA domain-containing protein [Gammaproteobacteria bacterium]
MTSAAATDWVVAVDSGGTRRQFDAAALPVEIGTGPGVDIALEGLPGSIEIARQGAAFVVQPARNAHNLRVGGVPVAGPRELRDGDVIAFDRARLHCMIVDGRLRVGVEMLVTAGDTAPPDIAEVTRGAGDLAITPIAFKPRDAAAAGAVRRGPSKAAIAAGAALAVLAVIAWFAFTAKSVELKFEPEADRVSLPGTLFKVRLGERFLLRPGEHRVAAAAAGYYPLDAKIDVGTAADQSIDLSFTKLPGLVTLTTDPETQAQVRLDGAPLGATPLTDKEIKPGLHRLEFAADRYLTEVLELDVRGGGERQALVAKLTPNWAPVTLVTQPAGATVLVDGVEAGVTPAVLELPAGERDVEVRLAGYNAWRNRVVVSANQPLELGEVKLAKADGRVEIVSNPSEASVSIDDEFRGRTPLTVRLTPEKPHRLTLAKPGFETDMREVSVAADSGRRLVIDLAAQYGEIDVRSEPASAEIWIDGQRRGVTPSRLTLTALKHVLEIRQPGYATAREELTPRPGYPQIREFKLDSLDQTTGGGYARSLRTGLAQELKIVPAGQFTMGTSRREPRRPANEILRPVKLTHAFYLGTREVTNAEFRQFKPDHDSGEFAGQTLNGDTQPVVRVTWDEVAEFMNWLSIKDGLQPVYEQKSNGWVPVRPLRNGYRLPTEAEWEWAARFAGRDAGLKYPWGVDLPPPDRSGNYGDISAAKILPTTLVTYNDNFPVSAPSGSFEPDALGMHDLGGNVAEWVQDYYVLDAVEAPELVEDPLGPETGDFHIVRGSSWRSATERDLRLAYRTYESERREDLGFRLARNLE